MPPISGHKKLAQAVFSSIHEGSYATDHDVASAELPSAALESLSSLLENARADVKNSISELSRLSATDIDGWIAQAKQLRQDIDQSEKQSQDIVQFAEKGQHLQEKAQDTLAKVKFLDNEVAFNDSVVDTLKGVQDVKKTTDDIGLALKQGQLLEAARLNKRAEDQAKALSQRTGSRLTRVIDVRVEKTRERLLEVVDDLWSRLIIVGQDAHHLTIHKHSEGAASLEELIQSLEVLNLLEDKTSKLVAAFVNAILNQLLKVTSTAGEPNVLSEEHDTIKLVKSTGPGSINATLQSLQTLRSFFRERLPQAMYSLFISQLDAVIVERLVSSTLETAVPLDLSGLSTFQHTIENVKSFAASMDQQSHASSRKLLDWAGNAPEVWLTKRSVGALNSIRQLLKRGLGQPRQVERVETQTVLQNDEMFVTNGQQEDWDAGWGEDDDKPEVLDAGNKPQSPLKNGTQTEEEDEGMSGWGFDDEDEQVTSPTRHEHETPHEKDEAVHSKGAEEDDGDAWGWGDEPESPTQTRSSQPTQSAEAQTSRPTSQPKPQTREITLRESYHITALPEQILDVVVMVLEDADSLTNSGSTNPFIEAADGLHRLPGTILSMFRASAPMFYANDINGSMFLYNDCLYLAEQLRSYLKHHSARQPNSSFIQYMTKIDIPDLETFGKRAYGKDMESKRTTLIDLLDGAQGFSNCTQEPFASQCDLAISSVIDFLRQTHSQWSRVLSRSALLQSIGSLLTTITNKMIIDVEDMSDISEPESQRLVSFCKSITTLEDLFLPDSNESNEDQEPVIPLTAAYTKTWLRFQYLSNILESSLVDIKYLWTEGELSIEFTVDEVVDLIEALFADSDHRRRAISDIRRSR